MARKRPPASMTRRLHRSLGAGTAVFVIFMVLSGLLINHSNDLHLDRQHVSQSLLLDWYGLKGPEQIQSFAIGSDWLSFAGSQLYLNENPVTTIENGIGAVLGAGMLIAAGGEELLLLDQGGNLIERIPWETPDAGSVDSVGLLADGRVAVKSASQVWIADTQMLGWQQGDNVTLSPQWSRPGLAPKAVHQAIAQHYRGEGLSVERVLLDFHSGRIFGAVGILVYDLLALTAGFLAISGLILWFRGRINGNRNGKNG